MKTSERNQSAAQLWDQLFAKMAKAEDAALVDPDHDEGADDARMRLGMARAGWFESEIEMRIKLQKAETASAPVTSPGVAPHVERHFSRLCDDIEAAMDRLGLDSHARVARGVEPRIGPYAAKTNVIMTDQSIVTIGSFLFRFCGLVARAFTRTLHLDPWLWERPDLPEAAARSLLRSAPTVASYWLHIFVVLRSHRDSHHGSLSPGDQA